MTSKFECLFKKPAYYSENMDIQWYSENMDIYDNFSRKHPP